MKFIKRYYEVEKNGQLSAMELEATTEGHHNMAKALIDKGFIVKPISKNRAMEIKADSEQ